MNLKGLAVAELVVVCCLLLVAWILKTQAEELIALELEVDRLRGAIVEPPDRWRERMPS